MNPGLAASVDSFGGGARGEDGQLLSPAALQMVDRVQVERAGQAPGRAGMGFGLGCADIGPSGSLLNRLFRSDILN